MRNLSLLVSGKNCLQLELFGAKAEWLQSIGFELSWVSSPNIAPRLSCDLIIRKLGLACHRKRGSRGNPLH